jgi:hypothetical protein
MPREITIASTLYQPGTLTRTVNNIPAARKGVTVTFTRESWPGTPDDIVATVTVTGTQGGQTFTIGPFGLPGGVVLARDGSSALTSTVGWEWPGENDGSGGRRELKITDVTMAFTVIQALRTAITIETF